MGTLASTSGSLRPAGCEFSLETPTGERVALASQGKWFEDYREIMRLLQNTRPLRPSLADSVNPLYTRRELPFASPFQGVARRACPLSSSSVIWRASEITQEHKTA